MTTDDFEKVFLGTSKICQGQGVFARRTICKNDVILVFHGPLIIYEQTCQLPKDLGDKSLQIGHNLYRGPSGEIDDYVNHSCDPNSYIGINHQVALIALRDIPQLEEIVFDYSTTMDKNNWEMDCTCRKPNCRGRIRDFKYLSKDIQEKYIQLGMVPQFILDRLHQPR